MRESAFAIAHAQTCGHFCFAMRSAVFLRTRVLILRVIASSTATIRCVTMEAVSCAKEFALFRPAFVNVFTPLRPAWIEISVLTTAGSSQLLPLAKTQFHVIKKTSQESL
jgi:hypothetical protein